MAQQEVLDKLADIRQQLAQLKRDRSTYLKSSDVLEIYARLRQVVSDIIKLDNETGITGSATTTSDTTKSATTTHESLDVPSEVPSGLASSSSSISSSTAKQYTVVHEHSPEVDEALDDVFQLMSLAMLTVGLKNTAPACYASLATIKRLLDHVGLTSINDGENHYHASTFTDQDLTSVQQRLDEVAAIIDRSAEEDDPAIIHVLKQKLESSRTALKVASDALETLDPELQPLFQKLVFIKRKIMAVCSRYALDPKKSDDKSPKGESVATQTSASNSTGNTTNSTSSDVETSQPAGSSSIKAQMKPLLEELRSIESKRVDGKFVSPTTHQPFEGQQRANSLIEQCHLLIDDYAATDGGKEQVDESLKPVYKELMDLKNTLEGLLVTHRWTLRETDLYFYEKQLQKIDDELKAEFTQAATTNTTHFGKSILVYLLRRCYAIIYKLLESSEPVSEALVPIHNQLTTARRCLLEVKKMGGLSSIRELYPYQMKLASIDNLRVDGKFMVGDTIPEGQGMLNALLSECFDIIYELKVELEERSVNSSAQNSDDEGGEDAAAEDDDEIEDNRQPAVEKEE